MSERTVIGSVPYLNAKPLIHWFETPEGKASGIDVIEAPPSELAVMLEKGEVAVALVSSFESFRRPHLTYVPGVSISGQDAIWSVRAFSHLPFSMIHTVAMDTSSLTSVALLTILLAEVYNNHPQHISMAPNLQSMLEAADAALLIGDKGMLSGGRNLQTLDLGKAWRNLTGLPFVYALWLGEPSRITPELCDALAQAKEYGLTQLDQIALAESKRLDCPVATCLEYLSAVIDFDLGEEHIKGLDMFREKVFANNLLGTSRVDQPGGTRILE